MVACPAMPDPRIIVVDDNQRFCEQVVSAFAEVGITAQGFARGSEALPVILRQQVALVVVDLLRSGSEGRWLLSQLFSPGATQGSPAVLALVGVTDDLSVLPDGVDALVRPVFPRQVVASAQRLLPSPSLRSGRQATLRGLPALTDSSAVHTVPVSSQAPSAVPVPVEDKITARQPSARSPFEEDSSDFAPGETLLAPESIAALAREMMRPHPDDPALLHSGDLLPLDEELVGGDEDTLPRDDLRRSRPPAGDAGQPPSSGVVLSGDLSALSLLDVIDLLARQRHSGILTVSTTGRQLVVYFFDGRIAQATAQGLPSLRLGRFLLELDGSLRQPEIDAVASQMPGRPGPSDRDATRVANDGVQLGQAQGPGSLLGQRLVRAGLLRPDELSQALARQSCELICEGLRLPTGRFVFERTRQLPVSVLSEELGGALQLDPAQILLEGQRRLDDWRRFEQDVAEGAIYVSQAAAPSELLRFGLSQAELSVLALCNGRSSVADLARESRLPLAEVSRTLSRLLALRLLRRRLPALLAL